MNKKKEQQIIKSLSPNDALIFLKILSKENEQIEARIAEIATEYLSEVDSEEIAEAIDDELNLLEVEEVWDRAGNTRDGYVEPSEAAAEMIDEVLKPYVQELQKYQQMGMSHEGMQVCKGLLKGLCTFDRESTSEFKNWAVDAPNAFAEEVIMVWKSGNPSGDEITSLKQYIKDEIGNWGRNLL